MFRMYTVCASTEVPIIAKVTPNIDFLDLELDPKDWAIQVLNKEQFTKVQGLHKKIAEKGYDIKNEAKKLEEFYISKYDGVLL